MFQKKSAFPFYVQAFFVLFPMSEDLAETKNAKHSNLNCGMPINTN